VTVFEVDVLWVEGALVVSHFLPVRGLPGLRRDGWSLTGARRRPSEIALSEALDAVPKGVSLLLDLKVDKGEAAFDLAREVAAAGLDARRFYVSSHGWGSLEVLRERGFRVWRTVGDAAARAAAIRDGKAPAHGYTVRHTLLTRQIVDALHKLAPRVIAWTVNSDRRAMKLAEWGVDGITSDSERVLEVVAAYR
jgi:glycerophosphoryl diester phosphodiesterase